MSTAVSTPDASKRKNLIKTLPGVLISLFFLWYTFKGISFRQMSALRIIHPWWIVGVVVFTFGSYTLRCVRWTRMMRSTKAKFSVCARILLTSLAANNILPLRIGDIMRVFTYAGDLGASPSVILSTVILEKLLDIFVLVLLFVTFMGPNVAPHSRQLAETLLAISSVGLVVLLVGARALESASRRLFARLPQSPKLAKIENWVLLALGCIREIGVVGSLLLLVQSFVIWGCEGMIFVSAIRAIGLVTAPVGPWQAARVGSCFWCIGRKFTITHRCWRRLSGCRTGSMRLRSSCRWERRGLG
jgi:uncharacterized membrane protein YbhN (UPF0104 family)